MEVFLDDHLLKIDLIRYYEWQPLITITIMIIMTKEIQSLAFKGHCQNPGPKSVSPASDISSWESQSIVKLNEALEVISSDQLILYVGD